MLRPSDLHHQIDFKTSYKKDALNQQILFTLIDNNENIGENTSKDKILENNEIINIIDDENNDIVFLKENLNHKNNLTKLTTSIASNNFVNENVSEDICFLHETRAPVTSKLNSNYYENDHEVDEKEVMKRWRCKKLSNAKINLSKINYRLRIFKEKNTKQPSERKFKDFFESENCKINIHETNKNNTSLITDSSSCNSISGRFKLDNRQVTQTKSFSVEQNVTSTSKNNLNQHKDQADYDDLEVFNERIDDIKTKYKELEQEIFSRYEEQKRSLQEVFSQQKSMLKYFFEQNTTDKFYNKNEIENYQKLSRCKMKYSEALDCIKNEFRNECSHLKTSEDHEINALKVLYDSGKYEKGKLNQYFTLDVMQPAAKRRHYDDNGHRQVLLPQDKLRNTIIEDTIYSYYYGEP